jgi:hypothetical protein
MKKIDIVDVSLSFLAFTFGIFVLSMTYIVLTAVH